MCWQQDAYYFYYYFYYYHLLLLCLLWPLLHISGPAKSHFPGIILYINTRNHVSVLIYKSLMREM